VKEWVKMPSHWLVSGESLPLLQLTTKPVTLAANTASLMVYIFLNHLACGEGDQEFKSSGYCKVSYSRILDSVGISRAILSKALHVLEKIDAIEIARDGNTNIYQVLRHGERGGWAKLPARGLYKSGGKEIVAFNNFKLRSKVELNALKLYLIILAFRDNSNGHAAISYDKIYEYTGIPRNSIAAAKSFLIVNNLIQVSAVPSERNKFSTAHVYRPTCLEPYKHMGTTFRNSERWSGGS